MAGHATVSIEREWTRVAHGAASRRVLLAIAAVEPDVAALGCRDLGELVEATSDRTGRLAEHEVHAVLAALLRNFRSDPLVGTALVRAFLPGLLAVARRMRWGMRGPWSGRDEFATDLVSAAWRSCEAHAGETLERPCRTVVEQAARSLRTERERHRRELARRGQLNRDAELASAPSGGLAALAGGLALVAGTLIDRDDAALLFENRVLGYPIAELAVRTGEPASRLAYRRRRAEAAVTG